VKRVTLKEIASFGKALARSETNLKFKGRILSNLCSKYQQKGLTVSFGILSKIWTRNKQEQAIKKLKQKKQQVENQITVLNEREAKVRKQETLLQMHELKLREKEKELKEQTKQQRKDRSKSPKQTASRRTQSKLSSIQNQMQHYLTSGTRASVNNRPSNVSKTIDTSHCSSSSSKKQQTVVDLTGCGRIQKENARAMQGFEVL